MVYWEFAVTVHTLAGKHAAVRVEPYGMIFRSRLTQSHGEFLRVRDLRVIKVGQGLVSDKIFYLFAILGIGIKWCYNGVIIAACDYFSSIQADGAMPQLRQLPSPPTAVTSVLSPLMVTEEPNTPTLLSRASPPVALSNVF